ncbi:hypothetical protein OsJ_18771 [Oryza sativa Japonica Group]|uniref:Uncharacterized protein n=1 Tax=Oryza sativa subsp. japonica TaxID=39947 RepID=B9FPX9_ORYSJ|nr:hypothetical protein OsJ_18771 [Oryza sativa Japonica Group]
MTRPPRGEVSHRDGHCACKPMGLCPCRVCLWGLRVTRNPACMRAAYVRGVGMRRKEDDEAIDGRRCIAGRLGGSEPVNVTHSLRGRYQQLYEQRFLALRN